MPLLVRLLTYISIFTQFFLTIQFFTLFILHNTYASFNWIKIQCSYFARHPAIQYSTTQLRFRFFLLFIFPVKQRKFENLMRHLKAMVHFSWIFTFISLVLVVPTGNCDRWQLILRISTLSLNFGKPLNLTILLSHRRPLRASSWDLTKYVLPDTSLIF